MDMNTYPETIYIYHSIPQNSEMWKILYFLLVGGIPTPMKNMRVDWDDGIPNRWKIKIHVQNHHPVSVSMTIP